MAYSQNGRQVLETYGGPLVSSVIPGTNGVRLLGGILGGDINTIAMYVASRWHHEIEPLAQDSGNWGYNYRPIRGQSSGFSNHASGSAWDMNAALHPLGTRTLTQRQLDVLRSISKALKGTVRFGAFFSGRADEMHAETVGTDDELAAVAKAIRNGTLPNVPDELIVARTPEAPAPEKPTPDPDTSEEDDMYDETARAELHDYIDKKFRELRDEVVDRIDKDRTLDTDSKKKIDALEVAILDPVTGMVRKFEEVRDLLAKGAK